MPETNSAMDELSAMKARYAREKQSKENVQGEKVVNTSRLLASTYWRFFAVLLAIFCGTFLFLAYKEITSIEHRKAALSMLEERLLGGEQRRRELSATIGQMTAQRDALQGEIVKLEAEAANYADSAAESRILSKTLPRLKEENSQLLAEKAEIQKSVAETKKTLAVLEVNLTDIQAKHTEGQSRFIAQEKSLQLLIGDLKKKNEDLAEIEKIFAEKKAAVAGANRLIEDYQTQLEIKKSDYERYKKSTDKLQSDQVLMEKAIAKRESAIASLRAASSNAEAESVRIKGELSKITKQFEVDQDKSIELGNRKELLGNEVASLKTKRDDISVSLNAAEKEMASLNKRLQDQNEKVEDMNQKVLQAENRLIDKEATVGEIEAEIDGLKLQRIELIKAVSRLQGQEEALNQKISAGTLN